MDHIIAHHTRVLESKNTCCIIDQKTTYTLYIVKISWNNYLKFKNRKRYRIKTNYYMQNYTQIIMWMWQNVCVTFGHQHHKWKKMNMTGKRKKT